MTEEEKKRLLQMAKNASKQNPTQAFNRVQSQLQQKAATQKKQQAAAQKASSTQKSSNPVNTIRKDTTVRKASASSSSSGSQQQSNGIRFAAEMPGTGLGTLDSLGGSSAADRRQSYLQGGSVRRRTNTDSRTGTNTSRGTQREADERNLQLNMIRWHNTTDPAERSRLNQENSAIRQRLGLSYDPRTGVTYNARTGRNYSAPTQAVFGGTVVDRMRQADQWRQSRMTAGQNEEQTSVRAHQVMNDLFSRSAGEWTEEDIRSRDAAVKALSDEMGRILERYGLQYNVRETGPNARFFVSDSEAVDRLRQAGADETTLAYVQENINQRQAADRLGQGFEAVAKRAIGSIPALFETAQQQAENVEQSRQNPEFVQLEQEEQQLESQLTSMPSTNYDGSLSQDYLEIYNQLQSVRERKNQLAVQTPVDQSKWGQTMLREAAEAQANATAGLATVPRFLVNQGISIAGNAPGMAASLIPGAGPVVGAGLMAAQTAGQRAQELSARGVSPSEALGRGVVSGLIEAVTEKLPIDHLSNILHSGGIVAVRNFLRQMGIEATEESASYVMNFAADWAANDPDAEFSFAELVEQALGGALSGGFYATVGTIGGRALAGPQAAQETVEAPQAGNYPPVMQETVRGDLGQRQQTEQAEPQALGQTYTGLDDFAAPLTQTLVKIDEQMRIAENLPAGPVRENRIQALREGAQEVSRQLAAIENNRTEFTRAQTIAERFGAKFALADLGPAGGKYENGTITINPYSSSPVRQVLVHELTHHLETSGQYDALQRQALSMFAAEQGVDVDTLRNNITQLYAQNGVQLDADGADRELTAAFCENRLFTDEASVQRLAQTDRSLFERIRQWIADAVARLRGTPEQREMLRLQQMYERAARTAGQREGYRGAQYSIDGRSSLAAQRAYREAVERGDTQTAEEILRQRYQTKGYSPNIDNRMMHAAPNSRDGYSARFDDLTPMYGDDIYGPHAEDYFGTGESYDGAAIAAIQNAKNNPNGLVTVYRAIPSGVPDSVLRNGDWVTTVEDYAREHGERTLEGAYRIIEETVPARYLYGNGDSILEFGYDNGNEEVYRSAVGNAKTAGITYDDYGHLIPLSQRFDESNPDRRYTFGFSPEQIAAAPEVQVPVTEAIRYGATPEQAMREAEVRAQGEALQAAYRSEREEMLNRITYEKPPEIDAQVRQAMNLAERVSARHKLRRADTRATPSDADRYINHESENAAVDLVNSLESERFFLRTLRKAWKLTEAELVNAQEIASGRGPVTQMNDHRYELVETYARALRNYWNDMRPAHDFYDEMNAARTRRAEELIVDSDNWEDAKIGYQLSTRTPLRVLRKVMGDTEQMRAIYEAYFAPVIQHDAESVRWENNMRNRLKDIIKGLSHEDSVYIHLKNRLELNPKNETLQKLYADYVEKHQKKIHFAEADAAMEKLIEFTQDLHPQINEAWVRNGIDPLEFHRRYLPSITPTKEGKWYNRILRGIGIETMADELPDEIAGRTENRRPGHQYASFAEERQGVNLEFDAIKAMDNYISNAATAIFHTDDIKNLRTLEETIRFKNADEGEQAELLAIMQNPSITIEDRVQQMSKIWEESQGNLPHFPSWIAEYTNLLAGKKARGDRQMESDLSRGMFRAMSDLEGKVAANMVGANLSTALSNFIPLTQGAGELRYSSMARAMLDYTYDLLKKDSMFRDTSDFLTNRRGSERVAKTRVQKASDLASIPVRAVDRMTSEVLTRARYIDNTKRGMNHQEALREADRWAAGLMGDRSKGAKPIVFDEKGPLKKAFTMFQLEVANQYDYLFGDIPANARAQGKGKAAVIATTAGALLQIFILSHLFNDAREKLTGTRGALDPIEIVNDFVGRATGYAMPNVFTMIQEAFAGDLGIDDFQVEASESVWDNAKTTLQDVASNVPFLSGPVGALFGASNSRLPIQSVVPDIDSILSKSGAARTEAAIKELAKPIYGIVFPFGGTQAKKTAEGIATMLAGGSYVHDNDGNLKLQFPAYGESPLDWARAAVFGKWSSPEAQEYIDNGFKGLSADETSVYNYLRDTAGVEPRQAMDVITSLRGFESVKDSEGNTVQTVKDQQRLALFDNENLTPEQKRWIDEQLLIDPDSDQQPADYTDYNTFMLYNIRDSRKDAARDAIATGLSIDQFVQWDDRLNDLTGEEDANGDKIRSAAEARTMVLDEVMQDSTLSDSEKQALADYVLISSIGEEDEKARKNWETIAKGKVNASDFVRFQADASVYDAWAEGTGTDNAANVAEILRGYDGLTDEQRDVLFQTYRDNMSVNPFHVSVYEKSIDPNGSFYGALTDDGKARLRSLLNEYEQDINEGAELDEWRAKAYMAEKEAGISPATYAMYRVALETANTDDKGNPRQSEAEACVNAMDGLTQYQKAYLYASTNKSWKNNPFGSATVGEYSSGQEVGINPVAGAKVTSRFGPRKSFQTDNGAMSSSLHPSIDIGAAEGTPIGAYKSGKVTQNGWVDGYGWTIEVTHSDGTVSAYHHMMEQSPVAVGTEVKQGEQIGKVGQTGNSKGAHLDLTITRDGKPIDPATLIPELQDSATGYVWTGSNVYTNVTSGSGQSSGSSGGSSGSKKKSGFSSNPFDSFVGFKGF